MSAGGDTPAIVIVGGGTAGWLSAAYLSRVFAGSDIAITLIEAEDIPPVGVGEATIPSIVEMVRIIGGTEAEFLKACDATFKQAIRFDNWRGAGEQFFHPFEPITITDGFSIARHWLRFFQAGETDLPYANFCGLQARLCEKGVGPKMWNSPEFSAPLPFAYHLDALKFARYLSAVAQRNGVTLLRDTVVDVGRAENGDIERLVLKSGASVTGMLFIDCTGFAGRLIEGVYGVPLVPVDDVLLCDEAVSVRLARPEGHRPRPFTTSTAQDAGWIWDLDLAGRGGSGYVYSSRFCDADTAARALAAHHGTTPDKLELRRQKMRLGYRRQFWVNNCLAIGLSGGFVEPLESTGIHMIEAGIRLLIDNFPARRPFARMAAAYNEVLTETYQRIIDFIALHYIASPRRDTAFWKACTEGIAPTPRLAALLERWQDRPPIDTDFGGANHLFGANNYMYILAGLAPERLGDNVAWALKRETGLRMRDAIFRTQTSAIAQTPPQSEYLQKVTSSV